MDQSEESAFEYNLPEGYDSQNEDNPEYIPVVSSGDEFSSDDEDGMPALNDISSRIMEGISVRKSSVINLLDTTKIKQTNIRKSDSAPDSGRVSPKQKDE